VTEFHHCFTPLPPSPSLTEASQPEVGAAWGCAAAEDVVEDRVAVVVLATGAVGAAGAGAVCAAGAPPPAIDPHQRDTALPPDPSLTEASQPEVGAACGAAAVLGAPSPAGASAL